MARVAVEAFDIMRGWLTPTAAETALAASHRASIEQALKTRMGMTRFFRSGSFGYGTSISGHSDVDYFAVIPAAQLTQNSETSLWNMREALLQRFPSTAVTVSSPAVVIPFGNTPSERHEIIPAYFRSGQDPLEIFGIPDRAGGWMASSPNGHGAYIDRIDAHHGGRVKHLIRFMKAWKYASGVPIRSFYLEMRTALYAASQNTLGRSDVAYLLRQMSIDQLARLDDPLRLSDPIYCCFNHEYQEALHKVRIARDAGLAALEEERAGRHENSFYFWGQVFPGKFPTYY